MPLWCGKGVRQHLLQQLEMGLLIKSLDSLNASLQLLQQQDTKQACLEMPA